MDELVRRMHERLVQLYVLASTCLEELRTAGVSAHVMSVGGNPFPGDAHWIRTSYPVPVIEVPAKGSIGFDPAGAFFVFAIPTSEATTTGIETLSQSFDDIAVLGAVNLTNYWLTCRTSAECTTAAVCDGEPALLVIVRLDLEKQDLVRLFRQAALIMGR